MKIQDWLAHTCATLISPMPRVQNSLAERSKIVILPYSMRTRFPSLRATTKAAEQQLVQRGASDERIVAEMRALLKGLVAAIDVSAEAILHGNHVALSETFITRQAAAENARLFLRRHGIEA